MTPLDRWNDDRLDELAATVYSTRDGMMRLAVLENRLDDYAKDTKDCKLGIEKLHDLRSEERREQAQAREEARKERKRDFYALSGVVLAAAMLVIAALGLFLG